MAAAGPGAGPAAATGGSSRRQLPAQAGAHRWLRPGLHVANTAARVCSDLHTGASRASMSMVGRSQLQQGLCYSLGEPVAAVVEVAASRLLRPQLPPMAAPCWHPHHPPSTHPPHLHHHACLGHRRHLLLLHLSPPSTPRIPPTHLPTHPHPPAHSHHHACLGHRSRLLLHRLVNAGPAQGVQRRVFGGYRRCIRNSLDAGDGAGGRWAQSALRRLRNLKRSE